MLNSSSSRGLLLCGALLAFILAAGCGGGGGSTSGGLSSGGNGGGGGTVPTAKTKSDASLHLQAYGQGIVSLSFAGWGPKLQKHVPEFDNVLQLWFRTILAPDGVQETLYQDQATTMPAGMMQYTANDVALTMTGPFSVTSGPYANCTGTYNEALQTNGSNGSINYSIPNVGTTVCQYIQKSNSTGGIFGTCTDAISLGTGGYSQTEQVAFNVDGTQNITATDTNSMSSKLNFAATFTSTGMITGSDPGLPATLTLDATGAGTITFADKSTATVAAWQVSG